MTINIIRYLFTFIICIPMVSHSGEVYFGEGSMNIYFSEDTLIKMLNHIERRQDVTFEGSGNTIICTDGRHCTALKSLKFWDAESPVELMTSLSLKATDVLMLLRCVESAQTNQFFLHSNIGGIEFYCGYVESNDFKERVCLTRIQLN